MRVLIAFLFVVLLSPALTAQQSDGDRFPSGTVWFNTEYPLTLDTYKERILVLTFRSPESMDAQAYTQAVQEKVQQHQQLQQITVLPGYGRDRAFTREEIFAFIQENRIQHPVAVIPSIDGFSSLQKFNFPATILYFKSTQPAFTGFGWSGMQEGFQLLQQWTSAPDWWKGMTAWQAKDVIEPMMWANPIPEYPSYVSAAEDRIFLTEKAHERIIVLNGAGEVVKVIGSAQRGYQDGQLQSVRFRSPSGTAYDPSTGLLLIADTDNHRVRAVDLETSLAFTLIGNGKVAVQPTDSLRGVLGPLGLPTDLEVWGRKVLVLSGETNSLYLTDGGTGRGVLVASFPNDRKLKDGSRALAVRLCPSNEGCYAVLADGSVWKASAAKDPNAAWQVSLIYEAATPSARAAAVFESGKTLLITLPAENRLIAWKKGKLADFAGKKEVGSTNGGKKDATFHGVTDMASLSGRIVVTDRMNHLLRLVHPGSGKTRTLRIQPTNEFFFSGDPLNTGESVFIDPVITGEGTTTITVTADIGDWVYAAAGRNEVHCDEVEWLKLESEELGQGSFTFTVTPSAENNLAQFEVHVAVSRSNAPDVVYQKKVMISVPLEVIPGEETTHALSWRVNVLPF